MLLNLKLAKTFEIGRLQDDLNKLQAENQAIIAAIKAIESEHGFKVTK